MVKPLLQTGMNPTWTLLCASLLAIPTSGCGDEAKPAALGDSEPPASAERGARANLSASWPRHVLRAEQTWQLNLPQGQRFDASALLITRQGDFLTVNDRGSTLYKIQLLPETNVADLLPLQDCFTPAQLSPWTGQKFARYDCEGLSEDDQGRIYLCEEGNRWILRCDRSKGSVERLEIDWAPVRTYFDLADPNASFEGVAVGNDRLYVANERQMGRIIVVDLKTLQVIDQFAVRASASKARDVHYSDLSWFDGVLYVLLRQARCVLAINPDDHRVLAEYDFRQMEREPDVLYRSIYPTSQFEGLAVDKEFLWLLTDNNGAPRARHPNDIRPTLFKARRMPVASSRP